MQGSARTAHHVLVEVVHHHPGQPGVAPVSVHEQQLLEVPEVGDGEVAGHDGLRDGTQMSVPFHGGQGTKGAPLRVVLCPRSTAGRA